VKKITIPSLRLNFSKKNDSDSENRLNLKKKEGCDESNDPLEGKFRRE
jgi:hypothetical protein